MTTKPLFDVLGLGASTLDIVTLVDHFPAGRENQQARSIITEGGGPVATAVVTAARLGARAAMIDNIGDDWAARLVLHGFEMEGVDTRCIEQRANCTTSISSILVSARNGDRAIMFMPGSIPELALSQAQRSAIESARFVHLNGRHLSACMEATRIAREAGVTVSFDGGADRFRPELVPLVPLTDICIVAKNFAGEYTGESEPAKAVRLLANQGPGIAGVTDGTNGSWICTRDGRSFHQPAFIVPDTVDTTGCGDSYHGGFVVALSRGLEVEAAAAFASAVAALNSRGLGGRSGIPRFEDVNKFLEERGAPTRRSNESST